MQKSFRKKVSGIREKGQIAGVEPSSAHYEELHFSY